MLTLLYTEEQIGTAQKSIATYKEEFTNAKEIRQHRQGNVYTSVSCDMSHTVIPILASV